MSVFLGIFFVREYTLCLGCPGSTAVKNPSANTGDAGDPGLIPGLGRIPGGEKMAMHSCIPAWKIPWTEEPGGWAPIHEVTKSWTWLSNGAHTCTHTLCPECSYWLLCFPLDFVSFSHPGSKYHLHLYCGLLLTHISHLFLSILSRNSLIHAVFVCLSCQNSPKCVTETIEICCLTVLGAKSSKYPEWFLSEGYEEESVSWFSPSFWRFAGTLQHSLVSAASLWSLPSSSRDVLLLCPNSG